MTFHNKRIKSVCCIFSFPCVFQRKALVMLFQHWFSAVAEEDSEASRVSACVKEVKKAAPSLLAFLVNLADDNGNTVLHYSVSHCNYSVVSVLLDTGETPAVLTELLHRSSNSSKNRHHYIFSVLIGVSDVNIQNNAGYTAVMLASLTAPDGPAGMEVVRRLMEVANINIRSNQVTQSQCQQI